ncbi:MFS transporter [Hydromonas duriensis]|uniref:Putative MFS family arabinose efflux permease n=1 Tax=Hydromonas duriensis TaxID=1527608 RepID=A0A4R6Y7F3_9BURK|nr:MFS transporter [Hydromonas duriensis]TDR31265.1 putative MFS family arabinose efflux permease [Hydromonas duriensis]
MNTQQFIRQVPFLAWVLMLATLSFGLFANILGSLTPEISQDMQLSPQDIGHLMMVFSCGGAIGAFLGGDFAHRFRTVPLLLIYFALIFLSVFGIVLAPSFKWLSLSFLLYAITCTAVFTVVHSIVTMLRLGDDLRPRLIALIDVGFSVGATMSPFWSSAFLNVLDDWRAPYAFFLVLLLGVLLLMSRPQSLNVLASLSNIHATEPHPSNLNPTKSSYLKLLTAPWARWAWLCGILIGFVEWGQTYWFVIYASNDRGLDADVARVGLAAFTGGMLSARIWQAFIHSRWSSEQRLKRLSVLGCVMFVLLALMPRLMPAIPVYGANFLAGVGIGVVFPLLLNHLIQREPANTSKFSALLMMMILFGLQLAGLVIGYLSTIFNVHLGYSVLAVAMLAFTFGVWRMFGRVNLQTP